MTTKRIEGLPYFLTLNIDCQSIREFRGFAEVTFINNMNQRVMTTPRTPIYIPRVESRGVAEPFMVSKI